MQLFNVFLNFWGGNAIENLEWSLEYWEKKYQSIFQILTTSPADYQGGVIWDMVKNVITIIEATGATLLIIFFFYGILKMGTDYRDAFRSPKTLIFQFARLVVAEFFVVNSTDILLYILSFCQGIMAKIHVDTSLDLQVPEDLRTALETADWAAGLGAYLASVVGMLIFLVLAIIIFVVVYGRFFKIFLLSAIAPIPLAGFASDATSSLGQNFMKSYIGECLRGIVILVSCLIFSAFSVSPTGLNPTSPGTMTWLYVMDVSMQLLILVIMVKGSDRLIKEIFGL